MDKLQKDYIEMDWKKRRNVLMAEYIRTMNYMHKLIGCDVKIKLSCFGKNRIDKGIGLVESGTIARIDYEKGTVVLEANMSESVFYAGLGGSVTKIRPSSLISIENILSIKHDNIIYDPRVETLIRCQGKIGQINYTTGFEPALNKFRIKDEIVAGTIGIHHIDLDGSCIVSISDEFGIERFISSNSINNIKTFQSRHWNIDGFEWGCKCAICLSAKKAGIDRIKQVAKNRLCYKHNKKARKNKKHKNDDNLFSRIYHKANKWISININWAVDNFVWQRNRCTRRTI